ncbi:MAG: DsbA family protein [Patescibacteria group bacterium]
MEMKNTQEGMNCSKNCGTGKPSAILSVILAINLIATATLAFGFYDYKTNGIKNSQNELVAAIEKMEADHAGGKEMYDLVTQYQTLSAAQQKSQIKAAIAKMGGTVSAGGETETPTPAASTTLSADDYAAVMKDAYVEGKKDAKITLVEYSDLECPYCIIQFKNKTISKLQEKYGDKINVIYKPLNLARHPGADQKGMASICVAQIGGAEKYEKFYKAILDRSNERGPVFPLDNIKALAKEVGVDATKFAACYDGKKTESIYQAYTAEAMKHGVDGTPTTMILNNETKKFELMKGAADVSSFYPLVDGLLK